MINCEDQRLEDDDPTDFIAKKSWKFFPRDFSVQCSATYVISLKDFGRYIDFSSEYHSPNFNIVTINTEILSCGCRDVTQKTPWVTIICKIIRDQRWVILRIRSRKRTRELETLKNARVSMTSWRGAGTRGGRSFSGCASHRCDVTQVSPWRKWSDIPAFRTNPINAPIEEDVLDVCKGISRLA